MDRDELNELRHSVPCAAALDNAGYAIDLKESTRRAIKYRRGEAIIIVIHEGKGWFDPLSDAKGDVFSLMSHLHTVGFAQAKTLVARLIDYQPRQPVWERQAPERNPGISAAERWSRRHKPWPGSSTWRYLREGRHLPDSVMRSAIRQDLLREGPRGSVWVAHRDGEGRLTGWEERGPQWRGFATGGAKVLFRFGSRDAMRLCVTEAAIDAMSLAALEGERRDSLYLSTGGGWAPATPAAIRLLAARSGVLLVAATDNNPQGDVYADRLEALAGEAGCGFERLRPREEDWNAELRAGVKSGPKAGRREEEDRLPHARRPRQG
ncbi:hypothetical protein C7I87_22970 [Mesorhizobium sp. SARCC-RB16n]|uniref:DUF3991 and toprim domain-containing protein n=1 Tax=Mesorhizobium sp. SARCC-RB16n TaxID=2116687 RepID=UPI00122F5248|nr:DUF3991 and toprim domain-containing protein [Mesorhizobium sp. SARCC-RB16n]KAA3448176.1 hypothetical protein C7I87_22970 [Mesorhizobium sp. SARCC-RB16n]